MSFLWRMTWFDWLIFKSPCIITLIFLLFPFIYCVFWQAYYYRHLFFRVFHHCPRLIISRKKVEMFVISFLVRFDLKFWILGSKKFQVFSVYNLFWVPLYLNYCADKMSDSYRMTSVSLCVNIFSIVNIQSSVASNEPHILWFDSRSFIITGMLVK